VRLVYGEICHHRHQQDEGVLPKGLAEELSPIQHDAAVLQKEDSRVLSIVVVEGFLHDASVCQQSCYLELQNHSSNPPSLELHEYVQHESQALGGESKTRRKDARLDQLEVGACRYIGEVYCLLSDLAVMVRSTARACPHRL